MKTGFTLLLTLLFVSLTLSIGLGVATLIIGEIGLSGSARESQLAFYAADSGVECALYWDKPLINEKFATSTGPGSNTITCAGNSVNVGGWDSCVPVCTSSGQSKGGRSSFFLSFGSGKPCVDVTVKKNIDATTVITSLGHNTCVSGARRVERGLEVSY